MARQHGDSGLPDYGGMRFALPKPTPVVRALLIANFGIFIGVFLLGIASPELERGIHVWLGLDPARWKAWFPLAPIWQILSYGFLHAGLSHVLWNMLGIYFFGTMLEQVVGSRRFLAFYTSALLAGALVSLTTSLIVGDMRPGVGASAGGLAVIVGAAVMQPSAVVFLLFIPITLKWLAVIFVAQDVYGLLVTWKSGMPDGIAHWAHLGGAAWGFFATRRKWIWIDPLERLERRRGAARAEQQRSEAERMDELLEKIHREGMNSLTRRERDFLKRVSSKRSHE